ncbi:hypothetical protein EC973_001548 [Apophysomyces ossiformis]|uniref:WW domain-containing protein n=1 Tax=Apophysomyces ossiformis TaxID=679940 RepID=A0A8H7BP48_9FUNG|nr:hypothetical protein EC973_001548 [Apophysomyces ossiformis]
MALPLPPNWQMFETPEGRPYFLNRDTGATTWEDPRSQMAPPPQQQGMSRGAKIALGLGAGAAVAGLAGLAMHEYNERQEEERREDELDDELAYERANNYPNYANYNGSYNGDTTVVVQDNGIFDNNETIVETDGYGDTTVVQRDDGFFGDDTTGEHLHRLKIYTLISIKSLQRMLTEIPQLSRKTILGFKLITIHTKIAPDENTALALINHDLQIINTSVCKSYRMADNVLYFYAFLRATSSFCRLGDNGTQNMCCDMLAFKSRKAVKFTVKHST